MHEQRVDDFESSWQAANQQRWSTCATWTGCLRSFVVQVEVRFAAHNLKCGATWHNSCALAAGEANWLVATVNREALTPLEDET